MRCYYGNLPDPALFQTVECGYHLFFLYSTGNQKWQNKKVSGYLNIWFWIRNQKMWAKWQLSPFPPEELAVICTLIFKRLKFRNWLIFWILWWRLKPNFSKRKKICKSKWKMAIFVHKHWRYFFLFFCCTKRSNDTWKSQLAITIKK